MDDVEREGRMQAYVDRLEQLGVKVDQLDGSMDDDDALAILQAGKIKDEVELREQEWIQRLKDAGIVQARWV
jgi:hypothetical protein